MKTKKQSLFRISLRRMGIIVILVLSFIVVVGVASSQPLLFASKTDVLLNDIENDGEADPGDTLRYTVVLTNTGTHDAENVSFLDTIDANTTLVAGSVRTTPIARHDSYSAIGNVGITVPAGSGVLANDNDPDGTTPVLTIASFAATSANGGSVSVAGDGSFTYVPAPGFEGVDSFGYTVQDTDTNQDTANVFITVSDVIWFIDNSAGGTNQGTFANPFTSTTAFNGSALPESGDVVFIYQGAGAYTGGIVLVNGEVLLGQGIDLLTELSGLGITNPSFSTLSASPAPNGPANRPLLTNGTGNGITLAANNTIRGLNVGDTTGTGVTGTSVGNLSISQLSISGSGKALDINGGSVTMTFDSIGVTSSTNGGVSLQNVSGTTNINTLSIVNSNSTGFLASSAGTLNITGASNSVNTTSGTAVNLSNTTIGSSGITFQSVNASNADTGITLNNTGAGDFTVTGTGTTDGSGGTLQNLNDHGIELVNAQDVSISNMNLTNAATTQEVAPNTATCTNLSSGTNTGCNAPVHMVNASNISLTNLTINGSVQHGVNGNNVNGLSISNTDVSNIGNENGENGMHFINLLGTVSFTNVSAIGSNTRNVWIENNTGTSNMTVSNSTFNTAGSETGLDFLGMGTANMTFSVTGSSFTDNNAAQLKAVAEDTSVIDATITGNIFDGNPAVSGNSGIDLAAVDNGALTFEVLGTGGSPQTFQPFRSHAINVFTSGGGTATGRMNGNTINGSALGAGIRVVSEVSGTDNPSITIEIDGNNIDQVEGGGLAGIHIEARDGTNGLSGTANIDATVTNNTVRTTDTVFPPVGGADSAIQVYLSDLNAATTPQNRVCLNATGNTTQANGGAFGETDFFFGNDAISGSNSGVAQMQGYAVSVSNTWFTVNGNTSTTTPTPFADGLGPIGGGTCATVATALPADNTPVYAQESTSFQADDSFVQAPSQFIHNAVTAQPDQVENLMVAVGRFDLADSIELAAFKRLVNRMTGAVADWVISAFKATPAFASGETVNLALGDLNAGQVVVITFDVTVDSPFPGGVSQVCNQGLFTSDNHVNLLTDDPVVAGSTDPTCTNVPTPNAVTFLALDASAKETSLIYLGIVLGSVAVIVYLLTKRRFIHKG